MQIICDLDGTITESKQVISPKMKKSLEALECPIIVISGASRKQMEKQLDGLPCVILAQSGNDTSLWQNKLSAQEQFEINRHIYTIGGVFDTEHYDSRGCQVAYSFTGHNAEKELKKNFDPKQIIRKAILKQHPFKSKTLTVRVAGTTCLDYTHKKGTKGENIKRWIKENKLNKKDCVFFGDALFKGGNDESVKGVINTVAVANPQDLMLKLKEWKKLK